MNKTLNTNRVSVCVQMEPTIDSPFLSEVEEFIEVALPNDDESKGVVRFTNMNIDVFEALAREVNATFDYRTEEDGCIIFFVDNLSTDEVVTTLNVIADTIFSIFQENGYRRITRGTLTADTDLLYVQDKMKDPSLFN